MANQKENSEQTNANSVNGPNVPKTRNISISTDGVKFEITNSEVSLLELREICRQILSRTGSP